MAEIDMSYAKQQYDYLVKSGQLDLSIARDKKLHELFGEETIETIAPESTADAMNVYMDSVQKDISGTGEFDAMGDDMDPLEDKLIQPLGLSPSHSEKRIMATEPGARGLGLASDFPTPKEMQAGALHWGKLSQKEDTDEMTETLVEATEKKEKIKDAAPALDAQADEVMGEGDDLDPEGMAQTTALTTEMEQENEGEQEGRQILMESPYAYGLEVYDDVIEKIKADRTATEGEYEFFKTQKQEFVDLANDIKLEIETYEDKIDAIAQEQPGEAYSGPNAFWAVIAAALGAGASAITGTPNFALQIMNKTIDDHLEKFKNDRDFKRKSIERQQLNLITERGRMLQMAQNASDSALASLKNRAGMEAQIATVEGIKQEIMANREKNDQQLVLALQQLEYKKFAAEASAKREYGDKYVPGLGVTSIKDSQGIKDALKKGRELMAGVGEIERLRVAALDKFEEIGMKKLIAQSAGGIKRLQGQDYIDLRTMVGSLWGVYKNDILKGGAALTPTEKIMIDRVIPEENVFTIGLGELKKALIALPSSYEKKVLSFQNANQFVPVTPLDYGYVQKGKPEAQMPDRGRLPSAESLKGKSRKASG